jgi:acyl-CoA thioesterase I
VTPPRPSTDDERRNFVRYTRLEQWPLLNRFPISPDLQLELYAQMLACSQDDVARIVTSLDAATEMIASQLLSEPRFRAALDRLPYADDDRVVALGDSITADRVGWFEILSLSLRQAGRQSLYTANLGLSGDTTADVLARYDILESERPTHVLVMLGTNDVRAHGRHARHRMVTPPETERNLRALVDLVTNDIGAAIILITPPVADQRRISASFEGAASGWDRAALDEVADAVRRVDPNHIDVRASLDEFDLMTVVDSDGIHPSQRGQQVMARTVVSGLATLVPSTTNAPTAKA